MFTLVGLIIITFLLEVNRAPFDLSEAESELIAGHTVEYGGFFFGVYYLGEYLHLYFFSIVISILIFGGWEFPNFLYYPFITYYNTFGIYIKEFYILTIDDILWFIMESILDFYIYTRDFRIGVRHFFEKFI
jgi:NADH-quinone oxidoreductase subunit H